MTDTETDTGDGQTVDRRRSRARRDAERLKAAFQWLLSDRRGRGLAWWLMQEAGLYRTSFTGDPATTAFQEGRRDIGLKVLHRVHEAVPDAYAQMINEQRDGDDA